MVEIRRRAERKPDRRPAIGTWAAWRSRVASPWRGTRQFRNALRHELQERAGPQRQMPARRVHEMLRVRRHVPLRQQPDELPGVDQILDQPRRCAADRVAGQEAFAQRDRTVHATPAAYRDAHLLVAPREGQIAADDVRAGVTDILVLREIFRTADPRCLRHIRGRRRGVAGRPPRPRRRSRGSDRVPAGQPLHEWRNPAHRRRRSAGLSRATSAGGACARAARRGAWRTGIRIRALADGDDRVAQAAMHGVAVHARMPQRGHQDRRQADRDLETA